MRGSNCFIFAIALYRRRASRGKEGYLVMRRSRWGPFPHLLYAERRHCGSLRLVSFIPRAPRSKPCPPVVFAGRSKWGDL
jgi:hypothetical protein